MHPVLIQEQALPDARYQLQLALLPIAIDIEGPARLYATQHAYQPFLNLVPGGDPPRYLFLAPRRDQILHRPPQGLGLGLTGLLQSLAHPQHMLAKFRQPHLLRPQVAHHSFRIADRPQGPSKDQPVEATQHSAISSLCFAINSRMAFPSLPRYGVLAEPPHLIENGSAFYVWLRLCRAVLMLFLPAQSGLEGFTDFSGIPY